MSSAVLNIGYSDFGSDPLNILEAAAKVGLEVIDFQHQDACFVMEVEPELTTNNTARLVFELCDAIGRECIAMLQAGRGYMVGPATAAYGEFDIDRFHPMEAPNVS